jgi:hypothetical protein
MDIYSMGIWNVKKVLVSLSPPLDLGVGIKTDNRKSKPKRSRPNPNRSRPKRPINKLVRKNFRPNLDQSIQSLVSNNRIDRIDRAIPCDHPKLENCVMWMNLWYCCMPIKHYSMDLFLFGIGEHLFLPINTIYALQKLQN